MIMKELTIEEKAKAYDDALENARYYHDEMEGDVCCVLEECFPQLRESYDEKIKKEILEYFQQFKNEGLRGINISDWISWLEKQGEQKPAEWSEEDEKFKESIIKALYSGGHFAYESEINWLKSLRPKNHWKPTEEQMKELNNVFNDFSAGWEDSVIESLYNDLKKLTEQ